MIEPLTSARVQELAAEGYSLLKARGSAGGGFDSWIEPGQLWRAAGDNEAPPALISGMLPLGGLAAIGGAKDSGKTWVLTDLALSIANGVPFLGHYPVEVPGPVLVIQTEGSRRPAIARYDAIARGKGLAPDQAINGIDFVWRRGLMLDVEDHLTWLREKALVYIAIIDDTLRDSHGGEENSNDVGGRLARDMRSIANEGPTFIFAQHFSKAGPDSPKLPFLERFRGNSALTGALDAALLLERRRGAARTAVTVYCRDDRAQDPFTFTWPSERVDGSTPITLDWVPGQESESSANELVAAVLRVVESTPGCARRHVMEKVPNRRDLVGDAIELALKQGRVELADTAFQDRVGRQRTRRGLYLAPLPQTGAKAEGVGEQREPDGTVTRPAVSGGLFNHGNGAGNGENGVLATSVGDGSAYRSPPSHKGGTVSPDRRAPAGDTPEVTA